MMIKSLKKTNHILSEWYVDRFKYRPYIQTILLHKIYNSRSDIKPINGTIAEGVDKGQFDTFIKFYKKRKVTFIDETDILEGRLAPDGQYIYLTFDDGYFNNFNCLSTLEKYGVKATFYITTDHIKDGKAYWWDSLSRELTKRDRYAEMGERVSELYKMKWQEQEVYLTENFGEQALSSNNDLDRPMNKEELIRFAQHECVTLGNHTHYHINLELYSDQEILDSISNAETFLSEVTDQKIKSISYPHGFVNKHISQLAKSKGYEIGITTVPKSNTIAESGRPEERMLLNRTQLSGYFDIEEQCRNMHTNHFSLSTQLKSLIK